MPAQKRPHEDDPVEADPEDRREDPQPVADEDGDRESDRSPSSESSGNNKDGYVAVKISDVRKEVQCPICLGVIRKTRTVMECLHRFCRECIDKSMRMGNNECPACRTHCASRRSLRDDPNYDALIAALYPDIDKYEEEESAFHEDEKARNKQIQADIALTIRRQSEALGRKRNAKNTAAAFARRSSQGSYRNLRGRRNLRNSLDNEGSDDNEDVNGNSNGNGNGNAYDSSSAEERTEHRPKRSKRGGSSRYAQPPSAGVGGDDNGNDTEVIRDTIAASLALAGSSERLSWGKAGVRSHNRHGSGSGNGKNARNSRVSRLVDCLRNSEENLDKFDINLLLVSVNQETVPTLKQPYLCCRPTLSIKHLSEYVARQTALKPDEVEIHLVQGKVDKLNPEALLSTNVAIMNGFLSESKVQVLREQQTLAELRTHSFTRGYLLLSYQKKKWQT